MHMFDSWENRLKKRLYPAENEEQVDDPSRNLIAAVIERALQDLEPKLVGGVTVLEREQAFDWLYVAENDNAWSLAWCCEQLGWCSPRDVRFYGEKINQTYVWDMLRKWGGEQAGMVLPSEPMK